MTDGRLIRHFDFRGARARWCEDLPPAILEELRAEVARGFGHECAEWSEAGRCLLCDRPADDPVGDR